MRTIIVQISQNIVGVFDTESITSINMSYTDVMQVIYLEALVDDIKKDHYGLLGVDGLTFGTLPGDTSGKVYLIVAGGGYTVDAGRTDKNYQVLYVYDPDTLAARTYDLDTANPNRNGPVLYQKLFIYTGQHFSGPQPIAYDVDAGDIWVTMYAEVAEGFPPYRLLVIDHSVAPVMQDLDLGESAANYEASAKQGYVVTLKEVGAQDAATGIWGYASVPRDVATGFISLGNDYFYVSYNGTDNGLQYSRAQLYRLDRSTYTFAQVSAS